MLERRERLKLEDGRELRLLSALEVLEARREAEGLARGGGGRPVRQRLPAGPGAGAGRTAGVRGRRGGSGGAERPGDRGAGGPVGRL
ncbi:hypothetical protein M5E87_28045 [Flavonifractor plautii]|nr:hypothetical protein M5E87_28045 [Flavonifractor plautii]